MNYKCVHRTRDAPAILQTKKYYLDIPGKFKREKRDNFLKTKVRVASLICRTLFYCMLSLYNSSFKYMQYLQSYVL